jgi:pimeloyl-ACP methyl ester carboxylesterase
MRSTDHITTAGAARSRAVVAGQPVVYDRAGAGAPLLLLHGWGGAASYWGGTLGALSGAYDIVAPDLPGFGESPPLAGEANAERLAATVIGLADALGLERFDLNGHSFCAGVAVYVAARHPERVRRLVLTCFSTFRNEAERRLVDGVHHVLALWMALRRPWMADSRPLYRAVGSRFFYRPPDDTVLRACLRDFMRMDRRTAVETAATAGDPAITAALRAVRAPTLLIAARQDQIMPPAGAPAAARLIPDGRLEWIERCGHLPMLERPAVYHRLLRTFLA